MMHHSRRSSLLRSIVGTIADYRDGEVKAPTPKHVETWIKQFDSDVQEPMLEELDHVLKRTYIAKAAINQFLSSLMTTVALAGGAHCSFWKTVRFLDIQGRGNSQREMLQTFDSLLHEECGLKIADCGRDPDAYLYLDDGIFTGHHLRSDIKAWIQSGAPQGATLHVVAIALHRGGRYYAETEIGKAARDAGKRIDVHWWSSVNVEDRKAYINSSDVLRPTALPDDMLTKEYAQRLRYPIDFRSPGGIGSNQFFSSEEGRNLLEQELLKAGARIRSMCPHLNAYQRPLGNMVLETLGFGSLIVTFRNCPNNCPLAFWAGEPWYPLFSRKTN
jgi:hypothetical protein